jgi:inosine/xanthosine triphosphate pyrophosphatase family protein
LNVDGKQHLFNGIVNGKIIDTKIGENGFGYDPIFIADGFTKKYDVSKLVYFEAINDASQAIAREKQLKTGFGRGYLKRRLDKYFKSRD